ncbi:NAD(P)-dependent dehydrogenase, short-chain alcohol dehydrogenase family [Devosia sp. YR412]|uniref:SDR family oxidoreductase n=1 Tax=Devosia sp. YR412 TaxID=1881030 RepID=UPI0008B160FB|nr:SDR family oxidoreductase [Devosia sp. YR412]SEP62013.1 NAD(P)-dependent dehydrogenase, short-chain alcohol dehydrogenase family [Devosia sp. YR412]
MSQTLSNKVALITGSSRGIGRATALAFAREGAALIGVHYASNAEAAQATVRDVEAFGTKAVAIQADLRRGKTATDLIWEQFKPAAVSAIGEEKLDILVNNAGIAPGLTLDQVDEALFDDLMAINLKAPFFMIQTLASAIRDNGRIINVSTAFTRVAATSDPVYAASKGAIETLTLALAPQFGARGITVNAIMPGATETDMNADKLAIPGVRAMFEAASAFGRVGQADDVAGIIAMLVSEQAHWTTGQTIDASGGTRL